MMDNFYKVLEKLHLINSNTKTLEKLYIPAVWKDIKSNEKILKLDFCNYLIEQFELIEKEASVFSKSTKPTIYNLFVRYTTAFDHLQVGSLKNIPTKFKNTGTFLKTIALLPYLKKLDVDILYLLPITSIGNDGKKGDLGSPYSIYNPYQIDENLSEPLLELPVKMQFQALVEAAHHIGIKVVCEFIFRTSSKDSQLAIEHPEWYYWIKDPNIPNNKNLQKYASPKFTAKELLNINDKIENCDFTALPEPHWDYQNLFLEPPTSVEMVEGRLQGTCKNGDKAIIPGAFADWPPDDTQPPWSDVTYLKIYDNPDFNYIAYNTVRMYDNALKQPNYEQTTLWRHIENIIPYYQNNFDIDGVMIDMGHALPSNLLSRIICKARRIKDNFLVWEENFVLSENSVKQGFNLVLGYLPFDQHRPKNMREFISNIENQNYPIACFATPETHNTPRAAVRSGGIKYSQIAYLINKLLPMPLFIHSGFELGETLPTNTGLGFEEFDVSNLTADVLPLFSIAAMDWSSSLLLNFILEANSILNKYFDAEDNLKIPFLLKLIESENDNIVAFLRKTKNTQENLLLVANYSDDKQSVKIDFENKFKAEYLLGENYFESIENALNIILLGHSFVLLKIDNLLI